MQKDFCNKICHKLTHAPQQNDVRAFGARVQDMELHPENAGRRLQAFRLGPGIGARRIDKRANDSRRGNQLVQQLKPLWLYLHVQRRYAGKVATWPAQAGDNSSFDRVKRCCENNGRL